MIIRFNENLEVEEIDAEESINAGNNLVNEIKVFMPSDFDFNSHKGYANFRLSDGKEYNNLIMERTKKPNLQLEEEKCYYYTLPKYLTKQKGPLLLTVRISPIDNMKVIANSGVITTNVNYAIFENGEEVVDPDIAEQLRQEIAEGEIRINEALEKSEEALSKANDALYHDATIVKVNGEVQQTWDATYAQKITEESANKFDKDNSLVLTNRSFANDVYGYADYYTIVIPLKTNTDYSYHHFKTWIRSGLCNSYEIGTAIAEVENAKQRTFNSGEYKYLLIGEILGEDALKEALDNFMLVEGTTIPTIYYSYNPNRHITNPQADLLKSEWEKQLNKVYGLLEISQKTQNGLTYSLLNGSLTTKGTPTATIFEYLTNNISLKKGTYYFVYNYTGDNKYGVRLVTGTGSGTVVLAENKQSFTLDTDKSDVRLQMRISDQTYIDKVMKDFMILDGDWTGKPIPSYQQYNGQIIHEKDIEPVLLWKNGSPGSNFSEQTITLSENIRNYKYCIVKYTTEPNRGAKFIKLGVSYSDYQITDSYPDETPKVYFKCRRFVINGSQIQVGKGVEFNGTSTSFKENAIIPLAIYGSNY